MSGAIRKLEAPTGQLDVERARDLLAKSVDLDWVKGQVDLHAKIERVQRTMNAGSEAHLAAAEIVTRGSRRLGELLAELKPHMSKGGGEKGVGRRGKQCGRDQRPHSEEPPKLSELGISKDRSSQAQKLAAVPEKIFEKAIVTAKNEGKAPTAKAVVAASKPKEPKAQDDSKQEDYRDDFDPVGTAMRAYKTMRGVIDKWPDSQSTSELLSTLRQLVRELEKRESKRS